jgi:hypothetical protein
MDTQVRTPQAIFMQPQRLLVPLFQRPYVWNEEQQWEPLWRDVERVATRLLKQPMTAQQPHFLGAVVFQQLLSPTSDLQQRTVIDGQQRLTTLQLLLDALHGEIAQVGAAMPAARLQPLIENAAAFCKTTEDRLKVWPTNRDRPAFNEVMAAVGLVQYESLIYKGSRLASAHRFFAMQCREWLTQDGLESVQSRAEAIERTARELLQIVVIDLTANENAQEIFETLNARGAVLTAADLIKNFVFQRLLEKGADVEMAYSKYWQQFETAFWEQEVSVGRVKQPRSSIFLNHWLIARTGEEVVAREVFSGFKSYADFQSGDPMPELLQKLNRAADVYRQFTEGAEILEGPTNRMGLFAYRAKTLESEVIKPVVLALLDGEEGPAPEGEIDAVFDVLESWLTRRMLVRATSKSYNKIMAEVVTAIRQDKSRQPGRVVRDFFATQNAETSYWPDDEEVRKELSTLPIYRKVSRARLRMVLEAIEDFRRGWIKGKTSAAGVRIRRGTYAIEHIMPQSWTKHWPLQNGASEAEREARIHVLGNLTLLSKKLNSTVSNSAWAGATGKAMHLQENDILLLNSLLLAKSAEIWDEAGIDARTTSMIDAIIAIWPVPAGHKSVVMRTQAGFPAYVEMADLLSAGFLTQGQTLYSRPGKYAGRVAKVLTDGRLDIDGKVFDTPSGAGFYVRQKHTNGWGFWMVDLSTRKSLNHVRAEYRDQMIVEGSEVEGEDDDAE